MNGLLFYSVGDLLKIKEQLTAQRDGLLSELVTLRDNSEKAATKQHEAEEANMKAQETILQVFWPLIVPEAISAQTHAHHFPIIFTVITECTDTQYR